MDTIRDGSILGMNYLVGPTYTSPCISDKDRETRDRLAASVQASPLYSHSSPEVAEPKAQRRDHDPSATRAMLLGHRWRWSLCTLRVSSRRQLLSAIKSFEGSFIAQRQGHDLGEIIH